MNQNNVWQEYLKAVPELQAPDVYKRQNGSRVWEKRKAPAFAGLITKSADGVTFLMLRK